MVKKRRGLCIAIYISETRASVSLLFKDGENFVLLSFKKLNLPFDIFIHTESKIFKLRIPNF